LVEKHGFKFKNDKIMTKEAAESGSDDTESTTPAKKTPCEEEDLGWRGR
jgi:hypothetical protein